MLQHYIYKVRDFLLSGYRRRRSGRVSDNLCLKFKEIADSLGAELKRIDPEFLSLGQQFQEIHAKTESLSEKVVSTIDIVTGNDQQTGLSTISDFVASAVETLHSCSDRIETSLKIFDSGILHMNTLSKVCDDTDKISLLLNVISLNIGIESNRSDRSGEMFNVFVQEVKALSDTIRDISSRIQDDSESARHKHLSSRSEITSHLKTIDSVSDKAETSLKSATTTLESIIDSARLSLQTASDSIRNISTQVGAIVINMQLHDIVRQKTEHIIDALNEASESYETRAGTEKSIAAVLRLQREQLNAIIHEIDDARLNISSAFDHIEHAVSTLYHCISDTVVSISDTSDDDSNVFSDVVQNLKQLDRLTSEAFELSSRVDTTVSEAMASSSDLLKYVDDVQKISLDLHRKALNAIIKAAHLGEMGRAIEIFAQEVTTTSNETNRFADTVTRIIETISDEAVSLETSALTISELTETGATLSDGISVIESACQHYLENTSGADHIARDVETSISESKDALSFLDTLSKEMKRIMDAADGLIQEMGETEPSDDQINEIETSSNRYTMESERLIHSALFSQRSDSPEPDSITNKSSSTDIQEDFSDSIELFEPDTSHTTSDDDIAISENTLSSAQQEETTDDDTDEQKNDELGDNIELF